MNGRKIAVLYSFVIGCGMLGMWSFFILSNQVHELSSGSAEIFFHLFAEFLTAAFLIASGISLLRKLRFSFHLFLVSLGMVLYTVIVSAGYYVDLGEWAMVTLFVVFQIFTAFFIIVSLFRPGVFNTQ